MADTTKLEMVKLEKRMSELDRRFLALNELFFATEASLEVLEKWVETSNSATDMEIAVLLRAIVRHRGLTPKQLTKKDLIKALLDDEFGGKLTLRDRRVARGQSRRR